MDHRFVEHYALLGLKPGAGWRELRATYRSQIRASHPDRFHSDPVARQRAEERTKAINRAYSELSNYYRLHSTLPLTASPDIPRSSGYATTQTSDPPPAAYSYTTDIADVSPKRFGFVLGIRRWFAYGVTAILVAILAWVLVTQPDISLAPEETIPATNPKSLPLNTPSPTAQTQPYFTYGSKMGDVYTVQGVPTRTDKNVWYYGTSKIYFRDGVVTHWEENREHPLKTNLAETDAPHRALLFAKGSSKADVRLIQGAPIRESDKVWDYGVSRVYFEGDRVVGWYESPIDPLKIRR